MTKKERIAECITYCNFLTGSLAKYDDIPSYLLLVPTFQRNYSWDLKHIRELIETIRDEEKGVYLGNLIIQKSQGSSGRDLIIDGQQRLITLSLISKALERKVSTKATGEIRSILYNGLPSSREKLDSRISFSRNTQQEVYDCLLSDVSLEGRELDKLQKKLLKSFELIKKEVEELVEPKQFLEKMKACEFVVIKFPEKDGYQLFEGLNSKGKGLSPVELTKTVLFNESARNLTPVEQQKVEDEWEEIERAFEKENLSWFGKFLRHQRFAMDKKTSSNGMIQRIRNQIKKNKQSLLDFQSVLICDASIYLKLRTASLPIGDLNASMHKDSWRKVLAILSCLPSLNLDQIYAVLLALVKYGRIKEKYLGPEIAADFLKLWSFLLLIRYSDLNPSKYEKMFQNFVYTILNPIELSKRGGFKNYRLKFFGDLRDLVPSEDEFVKNFTGRIKCTGENESKISDKNDRNYIKLLLLAYLLKSPDSLFSIEDGTIEHIIPAGKKKGLENWKIALPRLDFVAKVARYQVGNLTILEKDDAGNRSFKEKCETYNKSKYKRNKSIESKYGKLFASKDPSIAVAERGKEIATHIYKAYTKSLSS